MAQAPRPRQDNRPGRGPQTGPCPDTEQALRAQLQAIPAPYNFVPLADWVYCPPDGAQASHDLPFRDGLCGEIPFTLVADTPLLVGGEQRKATADQAGEVAFIKTPGGYAIPGSAQRGLLRAVLEIAGFGRLRQVDDARHGLRDIAKTGTTPYSQKLKVKGAVKTGFLRRGADGRRELVPCKMVRLDHRVIEDWLGKAPGIFPTRSDVATKYDIWRRAVGNRASVSELQFDVADGEAVRLGRGQVTGYPVFTGQISDSTRDHGKRRDFVFYDADEQAAFPITAADWRAFLLIHGDEDGKPDMSWPGYWRARFNAGEAIPVFYFDDGEDAERQHRVRLGLAFMPKLAWDFSVHDLIRHTHAEHLHGPAEGGAYDLADLLFGTLAERPERILKGRVSCGLALAEGDPRPSATDETILNGPKPTYFPNYLVQETDPSTGYLSGGEYATCIATQRNTAPQLRGFKRYPVRPDACVQPLTTEQRTGKKNTHIKLHPLPATTRFSASIQFHNLRPFELGALVWALTWGGNARLRHALGMGKPFGFGQVHLEIDWSRTSARRNADLLAGPSPLDPAALNQTFTAHMEQAWAAAGRSGTWARSPQLEDLLAMAEPARGARFEERVGLRHMRLQRCEEPGTGRRINHNEFVWAKQAPSRVLMDYAIATGDAPPRPTPPSPGARPQGQGASGQRAGPGAVRSGTGGGRQGPGGGRPGVAPRPPPRPAPQPSGAQHPWLAEQLPVLAKANNVPNIVDVWGGQPLAKAWSEIAEPDQRAAVRAEIAAYWRAHGWWDNPPKGAKRKAREIYGEDGA